jgi:hypothetical protein
MDRRTHRAALALTVLGLFLAAAGPAAAQAKLCQVAVGGPFFQSDGTADQGFQQPKTYPPGTNARDGATQVGSGPRSSFEVGGLGLSVRNTKAKHIAQTLANTKATSQVVVKDPHAFCALSLEASTSVINLMDGAGSFRVGATLKDQHGKVLANIQHAYKVEPNTKTGALVDIYKDGAFLRSVRNAGGNLLPPDRYPPVHLTLARGFYELIVEITVTSQAERQADLVADAKAALQ